MVGTTSYWEDELEGWLKPFLDLLAIGRVDGCVRFTWRG